MVGAVTIKSPTPVRMPAKIKALADREPIPAEGRPMSESEQAAGYKKKAEELREAAKLPSLSITREAELLMMAAQYDELARNIEHGKRGR